MGRASVATMVIGDAGCGVQGCRGRPRRRRGSTRRRANSPPTKSRNGGRISRQASASGRRSAVRAVTTRRRAVRRLAAASSQDDASEEQSPGGSPRSSPVGRLRGVDAGALTRSGTSVSGGGGPLRRWPRRVRRLWRIARLRPGVHGRPTHGPPARLTTASAPLARRRARHRPAGSQRANCRSRPSAARPPAGSSGS
jgi:hypothetical protein